MSIEAHLRGIVLAELVKMESIDFDDIQMTENKAEEKRICCFSIKKRVKHT